MPDITQHRIGEILRRVFELLWFEPDGLPVRDIFEYVQKNTELTEYEKGAFPFAINSPRYEVLLRVATIPLVKAGWLVKTPRGRWFITEKGRRASKQYTGAEQFFEEAIHQYGDWKVNEEKRLRHINSIEKYEAQENSWHQIKQFIQGMETTEFNAMVSDLLQAMGYYITWVAPPEKEKSLVDMIASSDPLGMSDPRIVVHVNHKGQVMTQEGLELVLSGLKPEDHGIIISSSGFTNQVKENAFTLNKPAIFLVDLETFVELWVEYYSKLSDEARHSFPLSPVYFLSAPE